VFAGTTRVGQALKSQGLYVISNDTASYSYVLGKTFIAVDGRRISREFQDFLDWINWDLNKPTLARDGYITQKFSREARFFQEQNARQIDGIIHHINKYVTNPTWKAVAQTSLLLAADKVDSTCGLFNAYLKQWAPRSFNPIRLERPKLLEGAGLAVQYDATSNDATVLSERCDLTYLDPPYNQHRYDCNYHVWETLVRGDEPETYGVVNKRVDCKQGHSPFNRKAEALPAMQRMIRRIQSPFLLTSFSNEGYILHADLLDALSDKAYTRYVCIPHQRYIGASIGVYNPQGEKVGEMDHTRNVEYLFITGETLAVNRAADAVEKIVLLS
jgi:adenine-specific DNA-methyltransferase